jgi:hypothetical protein
MAVIFEFEEPAATREGARASVASIRSFASISGLVLMPTAASR